MNLEVLVRTQKAVPYKYGMRTIALFIDESSDAAAECGDGIVEALSPHFHIKRFTEEECTASTFKGVDMIAFPGGVGESEDYNYFFRRKREMAVVEYLANGGSYLGICVGAYWAGSHYFDVLDGVDAVQYIKRPTADIKRSYNKAIPVTWNGKPERMFFRDGCAFIGDQTKFETVARYANGDPMAIIQGKIGLIGACPDSLRSWYIEPYNKPFWHDGAHHQLLLEFVNKVGAFV